MSSTASSNDLSGSQEPLTAELLRTLLKQQQTENKADISAATKSLSDEFKVSSNEIKSALASHNNRIKTLEVNSSLLQQNVIALKEENELLWKQVTKNNLIISGITDLPNESTNSLSKLVVGIIKKHTNLDVEIESIYRLGKFLSGKQRSIKVTFARLTDRNSVWKAKGQFRPPIYINEDLPKSVQKEHSILKHKKRELIQQGYKPEDIQINYNKRFLQFQGLVYYIQNDRIDIHFPSAQTNNTEGIGQSSKKRKLTQTSSQVLKKTTPPNFTRTTPTAPTPTSSQNSNLPPPTSEDYSSEMDDYEDADASGFLGDGSPNLNQTAWR